jgi:hypothetical protein
MITIKYFKITKLEQFNNFKKKEIILEFALSVELVHHDWSLHYFLFAPFRLVVWICVC